MKNLTKCLLFAANGFFTASLFSMTLKDLCVKSICNNPRYYIEHDILHEGLYDLEDVCRQCLVKRYAESAGAWFNDFLISTCKVVGYIPAQNSENLEFNNDHTLIRTYRESWDDIHCEPFCYDFNGKCVSSGIVNLQHPEFIPDTAHTTMDLAEIEAWRFKKPKSMQPDINYFKIVRLSYLRRKIVTQTLDNYGIIYDIAPYESFVEYLTERAPLAQLLLIRVLEKAHEENKKVTLTYKEKKILDAFPPQYENAIKFLRNETVKSSWW